MALNNGADEIITGAFANLDAICEHLVKKNKNVLLACAAWKDRVNFEDSLFAGAVINKISEYFSINCDASQMVSSLYDEAKEDLFGFMQAKSASHYKRLMGFGLEKDIRHCLTANTYPVLPVYEDGKLVKANL